MLKILDKEESTFLLDCGEGTAHQLSLVTPTAADHVALYQRLNMVYISHMHADHHLGLCQVLQTWQTHHTEERQLYLAGPARLMAWLREYATVQPGLLDNVLFLSNDTMVPGATRSPNVDEHVRRAWSALGLQQMTNVVAKHCYQSFSVVLDHQTAGRLVYSGDTRPNAQLVKHGLRARLLVHEATFENDLLEEAKQKRHSTIDEALTVARDMKAEYVLLTHFSQRYPDGAAVHYRQPKPSVKQATSSGEEESEEEKSDAQKLALPAVIAFDLMQIKLSQFWKMRYYKKAIYLAQDESNLYDDQASQEDVLL